MPVSAVAPGVAPSELVPSVASAFGSVGSADASGSSTFGASTFPSVASSLGVGVVGSSTFGVGVSAFGSAGFATSDSVPFGSTGSAGSSTFGAGVAGSSTFGATGASVSSLTSGLVSADVYEAGSSPDSSALSTTGADTG